MQLHGIPLLKVVFVLLQLHW